MSNPLQIVQQTPFSRDGKMCWQLNKDQCMKEHAGWEDCLWARVQAAYQDLEADGEVSSEVKARLGALSSDAGRFLKPSLETPSSVIAIRRASDLLMLALFFYPSFRGKDDTSLLTASELEDLVQRDPQVSREAVATALDSCIRQDVVAANFSEQPPLVDLAIA